MKVKKYIAPSLKEALQQIKDELGEDAYIVNTREFKEGGVLGAFKDSMVEVTAAIEEERISLKKNLPIKREAGKNRQAQGYLAKKYMQAGITEEKERERDHDVVELQKTLDKIRKADKKYHKNDEPQEKEIVKIEKKELDELKNEMKMVKELLNELNLKYTEKEIDKIEPNLKQIYNSLLKNEIEKKVALKLIDEIKKNLQGRNDIQLTVKVIKETIISHIQYAGNIDIPVNPGQPYKIAFVGPTGVGKTTTLAKLAAIFALKKEKKVGLITIDTYRIAAVEN